MSNVLSMNSIKALNIIFYMLICCSSGIGQTTTTTFGGQKKTVQNSAYVTPVVTKTYTPAADSYTWDNTKSTFKTNASYTAPTGNTGSAGTAGTSFNFRILGRPKWERVAIRKGKIYSQVSNKRDKMASLLEDISIKIVEQGKAYDSGKYFGALEVRREIGSLLTDLRYTRNAAFEISKSADDLVYPSSEVMNVYHFYSLLTSNRIGGHAWVLSEYLESYTNCYTPDNKACQQDVYHGKMTAPPFANTCSIRECPEKVYALEGLSMEAIFEIELAFTESAALAGHKDFAQKNFKGIMDHYAGKVQLSPYYLYLAGIVTAIDQKEFAAGFVEKYMAATGNSEEGKIQLKLFFQKMAMFYFSKGNQVECRKFMEQYYSMGKRSVQERAYTVDLLKRNRFTAGRENKLILQYLILETDSLLREKDYLADTNTYCLTLMEASDLYRQSKK